MKRLIAIPLLALALFLSACGAKTEATATPTATPIGKTGIMGRSFLAECQGDQVASDCISQKPYQATLIIYNSNLEEVTRITTADDGTFEIELDPGTYYLHPQSPGIHPVANDYQITVTAGAMTEVTIVYDSGLR
jgi:major membrane immunogen (membrane-anchored lipoprotein)